MDMRLRCCTAVLSMAVLRCCTQTHTYLRFEGRSWADMIIMSCALAVEAIRARGATATNAEEGIAAHSSDMPEYFMLRLAPPFFFFWSPSTRVCPSLRHLSGESRKHWEKNAWKGFNVKRFAKKRRNHAFRLSRTARRFRSSLERCSCVLLLRVHLVVRSEQLIHCSPRVLSSWRRLRWTGSDDQRGCNLNHNYVVSLLP